jgi:hypothetical protein
MPLFLKFIIFLTFIHTIQSHIRSSFTIRRGPSSWKILCYFKSGKKLEKMLTQKKLSVN